MHAFLDAPWRAARFVGQELLRRTLVCLLERDISLLLAHFHSSKHPPPRLKVILHLLDACRENGQQE